LVSSALRGPRDESDNTNKQQDDDGEARADGNQEVKNLYILPGL
jgi:hypothetical protein